MLRILNQTANLPEHDHHYFQLFGIYQIDSCSCNAGLTTLSFMKVQCVFRIICYYLKIQMSSFMYRCSILH